MPTTTDLDPTVARAMDAFNDHDAERLLAEFAEDSTFSDPFVDELTKAELRGYTAEVFEAFPDVRYQQKRVISGDDGATAVELTIRGTHEGEFDGIPPTGTSVALPGVSIVTVSEDGITSWRDYFDQRTFAEQLGLD